MGVTLALALRYHRMKFEQQQKAERAELLEMKKMQVAAERRYAAQQFLIEQERMRDELANSALNKSIEMANLSMGNVTKRYVRDDMIYIYTYRIVQAVARDVFVVSPSSSSCQRVLSITIGLSETLTVREKPQEGEAGRGTHKSARFCSDRASMYVSDSGFLACGVCMCMCVRLGSRWVTWRRTCRSSQRRCHGEEVASSL